MGEEERGGERPGEWKRRLKRVPGAVAAYRWLRHGWWRLRAGLAVGSGAKRRVAGVWGGDARERAARTPRDWLDSQEVLWRYVFPQFGGDDWYQYVKHRYCAEPRALGLSLCCGDGHIERDFIKRGLCAQAEGVDVAPEAVAVCRREAEAAGLSDRLSYRVADVERARLPADRYDIVVAWMALHHVRRLGHVFREVRRALRPGGIFVVNEYVGPSRFQVPVPRVEFINSLLRELPGELRRTQGGWVKERFERPLLWEIVNHDPSEAVRSDRILPLLRRHFALAECIGYGGTVLYWLLQGIVHNFDPDDPEHRAHLDRLYAAEREALASGRLQSDFAFAVARAPADGVG